MLRRHILPDRKALAHTLSETQVLLPVLGPRDRRAFALALAGPILPFAEWDLPLRKPEGRAQVYLDVSGSMNLEMPIIIALLSRLRHWIRMPFWAFSDRVTEARIEAGRLVTESTGGTSLEAVLDHLATTRPEAAVIVTDGFVGAIDRAQVRHLRGIRIRALVTRWGSTRDLEAAGLDCTQLKEYPDDQNE